MESEELGGFQKGMATASQWFPRPEAQRIEWVLKGGPVYDVTWAEFLGEWGSKG